MNTQKGFAPILIILLGLVVIGGGVYLYINNNNEKAFLTDGISLEDMKRASLKKNEEVKKEVEQTSEENIEKKSITYTNSKHGYSFNYDSETEIKGIDDGSDPTSCLLVKKGFGYILISSKAITPCGPTGVGIDMIRTVQDITIGDKKYTAGGFVNRAKQSLSFFTVDLTTGISISFGVNSGDENKNLTNDEYKKALNDIENILLTFKIN